MVNSLITIIVPLYNTEQFLHKCVNSILAQTYSNLEIILVDDGSTDNCLQICNDYAKKDSRIKVIQKENGGQGSARNMALEVANGEYIGFVDSDDWITEDMYEFLISIALKEQADIIGCGSYKVEVTGKIEVGSKYGEHIYTNIQAYEALVNSDGILNTSTCSKLFRSSVLKDVRFPEVRAYEDDEFIYKAFYFAKKIIQTCEPKYYYLKREHSTMTSHFNTNKMALHIVQKNIANFSKQYCPRFYDILMKITCSKQMYSYYQLSLNGRLDPNGILRSKLRKEILADYHLYISNPYIGNNKYVLWLFKYWPTLAVVVFKTYFSLNFASKK